MLPPDHPKSIIFFLMDGDPKSRIKCTLANWTGVAYKIPRTALEKCKDRKELMQSGVYLLFGTSDQSEEPVVYIGQAGVRKSGDGILTRLLEHKRDAGKDYWTEAVVFTTSNDSFGPTEISYLENRFTNLANQAARYVVKNANEPTMGNAIEEKACELEAFIEYASIIVGTLGYPVFAPLTSPPSATTATPCDTQTPARYIIKHKNGTTATASLTNDGVVVHAGSVINPTQTPACPAHITSARAANDKYINDGVLQKDLLFKSPSGAAGFVLGYAVNGYTAWKNSAGIPLKKAEFS